MRFGIAGLLGLSYVISYPYKKFEKEIFVFGIIAIVPTLVGPYYDEARFSKYAMVDLIGFASLMVYKMLSWRDFNNPIRNTAIISVIIITSGLSILIFIGLNSLILQTQDYTYTLPRRHFPSPSDLHMYEALHNMINTGSDRYNVISFSNEYDRESDGIMPKISAFAGLPYDKLRQSPLGLNSSTLDTFFQYLDYANVKYILLPKYSIKSENTLTEPTRFAIDNFKRVYEDKNYIILEVPVFEPPASTSSEEIAVVYPQSNHLHSPAISDTRFLEFDNKTFNIPVNDSSVRSPNR